MIEADHIPASWKLDRIIPSRVTIETVFGCNARCPMCVIENPTPRQKGIMPMEIFKGLVDSLIPYRENLELFDFYALGEPLLDRHIFERIRYVKDRGFRRLAFSTNVHLLDINKQRNLLESGIDTVILSVDGTDKKTHEAIRPRTCFKRVVRNALSAIKMRDEGDYITRFILRFIRQRLNVGQWDRYKGFWERHLSAEKGDLVTSYDLHNWAGQNASKRSILGDDLDPILESIPCHHAFENLTILADGSVPLCSEDILKAQYSLGNAIGRDPVDVFNSPRFKEIRAKHLKERKNDLPSCKDCTLLYSEKTKSAHVKK